MRIKANDAVEVLRGDDRGTRARVLKVLPKAGKVLVEGVNRVYKHVKRSQRNPQGGRLSKEMPVNVSNVALVCTSCGARTRVGARLAKDGAKERYCKKCSASLGAISAPKTKKNTAAR